MNPSPAVQEENWHVLCLVQAMLGSISCNFRAVYLALMPHGVRLHFILEEESSADRVEIDDINSEFLGLQCTNIMSDVTVAVIHRDLLPAMDRPWRMVYSRRNPWGPPQAVTSFGQDG